MEDPYELDLDKLSHRELLELRDQLDTLIQGHLEQQALQDAMRNADPNWRSVN